MTPKYKPSVAGAFAYIIIHFFFIPTRSTFGSNISPAEYEPLARARTFLAEHLPRDEPLVMKHADIINFVKFDVESDPSRVSYNQATPDTIHKDIYDYSKVRDVNTPRNPFVYDILIAETRRHMPTTMAASIDALYAVLGCTKPYERRPPIRIYKFDIHKCSY